MLIGINATQYVKCLAQALEITPRDFNQQFAKSLVKEHSRPKTCGWFVVSYKDRFNVFKCKMINVDAFSPRCGLILPQCGLILFRIVD